MFIQGRPVPMSPRGAFAAGLAGGVIGAMLLAAGAAALTIWAGPSAALRLASPAPSVVDEPARGLDRRVAALEASAPRALDEARAAREAAEKALAARSAAPPPAARAAAALALLQRFDAGEGFADQLAALERLGVEPAALNPLRPFAQNGAPSPAALAGKLADLSGRMTGLPRAAVLAEVVGLAKVRKVGGADAMEATARMESALRAGDLARARAAFDDLPGPAQDVGRDWAREVEARLAAQKAAEALLGRAVAALGAGE
jgi:hypothetical protein